MGAVLLGALAALSWATLDLIARSHAERFGPFRMTFWTMLIGGLVLTLYFAAVGWPKVGASGLGLALAMGVAYGVGAGALFKAFSLGPISIVGPLTQGYPALVLVWGMANGLAPTALQWLALPLIFAGAYAVARFAATEGPANRVAEGDFGRLLFYCALCMAGYAVAMILTQSAAVVAGEVETVWLSRATAALVVAPFIMAEGDRAIRGAIQWTAVAAMGVLDCIGVLAVAYTGHLPGKEFAIVAASTYGAIGVGLAALVLKEKVVAPQWLGVALIVAGVSMLALAGR